MVGNVILPTVGVVVDLIAKYINSRWFVDSTQ